MLMTAALHLHMDSAARGVGPSPSYDLAPSPPTPATAAPHNLRPARRVAKRRPRPSRKLPTTYIAADPASFRRMVHQVTGAHDLPITISSHAPPAETLCRPPPSRAGAGGAMTTLPTLDTSAFLLAGSAGGVGVGPAGGGGACNHGGTSCGGGFPTLDSWDALFQQD